MLVENGQDKEQKILLDTFDSQEIITEVDVMEITNSINRGENYKGAVPDLVVVSYSENLINTYDGNASGAVQMVVKFKAEKNVYGGTIINNNYNYADRTGGSRLIRNDLNGVIQYSPI